MMSATVVHGEETMRTAVPRLLAALAVAVGCVVVGAGCSPTTTTYPAPRFGAAAVGNKAEDDAIARDVRERIGRELGRFAASTLNVEVSRQVVSLAGSTRSLLEKRAAIEAASRARGVLSVSDAIDVMPRMRNDEEILADVVRALDRLAPSEETKLSVTVDDGVVTLRGEVHSPAQTSWAAHVAATVNGVCDVQDRTVVLGAASLSQAAANTTESALDRIAERVRDALSTDPRVVSDHISVYAQEGQVVLRGTVPTLLSARAALDVASHTAGVQSARSLLTVAPTTMKEEVLADRLGEAFADDAVGGLGKLRIQGEHGRIKLTGPVSGELEHARAVEIASSFDGVQELDDGITVSSRPASTKR